MNNRATPYDWLKIWWICHTDPTYGDYGLSTAFVSPVGLLQTLVAADPDSWVEAGDVGGGSSGYPPKRLQDAAGGVGSDLWFLMGHDGGQR